MFGTFAQHSRLSFPLLLLSVLIVGNNKLNYLIVFWIYCFTNFFNVKSYPETIFSTIQITVMKCLGQCNNNILLLTKNGQTICLIPQKEN